jgi:hypothetical protein
MSVLIHHDDGINNGGEGGGKNPASIETAATATGAVVTHNDTNVVNGVNNGVSSLTMLQPLQLIYRDLKFVVKGIHTLHYH